MMKIFAAAAATLLAAAPATAATYAFDFSGSGVSGSVNLTYAANPDTGVLPGTSPNPVDPVGSYVVTGISGSFSDANIGIANAAITGIVASNPGQPSPTNLRAPHSFGFYLIASGVTTPDGTSPGLSYDNLFYPAGSPQTASDYPFHGGIFDIYGVVFTIAGGNAVNLWSNGDMGRGVSYGIGVTDGQTLLDYAGAVSVAAVPEPKSWTLMIAGFGLVGAAMRRRVVSVVA